MRVIIAGSRTVTDYAAVEEAVRASDFSITLVVSGHAAGVDQLGEIWASRQKIPVATFLPDWRRFGRSAGIRRNEQMILWVARQPEQGGLIGVWDGASRGTRHAIECARQHGLLVYVHRVNAFPDWRRETAPR